MDASELAELMLEWEKVKRQLDEIEEGIKAEVLKLGVSQQVGNVRATYSAGRKRYDYEDAVNHTWNVAKEEGNTEIENLFPILMNRNARTVYDYRTICQEAGIENVPFTQGEPSVSIKLQEKN